ncbi:MAG: DNA ligase D, partial [Balneolales bacterium]
MSLNQYKQKRDFKSSPEPGAADKTNSYLDNHRFVVQRHDASRLHYDLRLEVNGVLKSWAIPKGPSLNPDDKRLAINVEDHPMEYIDFEGEIPKGNYGAGIVEIWDSGTYEVMETSDNDQEILKNLDQGMLKFRLNGEKLKGGFELIRIKNDSNTSWLFRKRKDEFAVHQPYSSEDFPPQRIQARLRQLISDSEPKTPPPRLQPMLAKVKKKPFDDPDWIFEIKWDGYRTIAEVERDQIELLSRNGLKVSKKYKTITEELKKVRYNAILDGELVILDEEGHANFQELQHYDENKANNLCYYAFDLLYLEGQNLLSVPLIKRKKLLKEILPESFKILYSDHIVGEGISFFEMLRSKSIEGMMAKYAHSKYIPGKRSSEWLKIKAENRQDAVIGGFTEPKGSREYFGSLILGVYVNGELQFIGHSGGGFSNKSLSDILKRLKPLKREQSPFKGPVNTNAPVTWVEPELVCEVSYTEWTRDGHMRHPKFLGLRLDKDAREVVLEAEIPDDNILLADNKDEPKNKKVEVEGHTLALTNLNKLYWPDEKYTKGDLITYYDDVADFILPYLKDRPESLNRHPEGITKEGFYQKEMGDLAPKWAETISIYSDTGKKEIQYLLCQNKATLIFMANLGCIELHPLKSRIQYLDNPDYIVIDIDPGGNSFEDTTKTALTVKSVLDDAGIRGYCKTSGSSGIHIFIPLGARYPDEQARNFAHLIAQLTHERIPEITSMERSPKKRNNKIYLDYLQNKTGQTLAATYSVRPKPGATVSTPVTWAELEKGIHPSLFNIFTVPKRIKKTGDLF